MITRSSGKRHGNLVHDQRVGIADRCATHGAGALMEQDRQSAFLGVRVNGAGRIAQGFKILVVWRQLDPSELQVIDTAVDFVKSVGIPGVDGDEADQFVGVGPDIVGRGVVEIHALGPRQGSHLESGFARFGRDGEDDCLVHRLNGFGVVIP